ncbi:T9SS type B sorting domain-containing protein [Ginsengibacter hankyongi]|uniref:T9SS type B sorting domain-containing protein n=1 Tax=Ginsengibacter hankyongi TaxID=2607284 RepID=A0A5J5ICS3_9BACT|nr:T9SS type B sorting domain-containing protein [Ginsengibacter hankyongi]KAA9035488.1 T9SS type B sorting domain-containing protein [Ginsengibacter hankyongi]
MNGTDLNNSGMSTYSWSPANGLNNTHIANPIATPGNDITYLLTITTVNGCAGTARINIKVFSHPEIYVPTAFTPNSDAINDILEARPVGLKEFRLFSIYNRLGKLVFSTTDAGIGWNGIYHSKAQPADIYVWIAEGVSYNGTIIRRKGIVALIR